MKQNIKVSCHLQKYYCKWYLRTHDLSQIDVIWSANIRRWTILYHTKLQAFLSPRFTLIEISYAIWLYICVLIEVLQYHQPRNFLKYDWVKKLSISSIPDNIYHKRNFENRECKENPIRQFGMILNVSTMVEQTSKNSKYAQLFFFLDRSEQYE